MTDNSAAPNVTQEDLPVLDAFVPLKFKLYLSVKERQAYRLAANIVGKVSIADYIVHAIQTYTTFIIKELQTQVEAKVNQTTTPAESGPTVEADVADAVVGEVSTEVSHVTEANS